MLTTLLRTPLRNNFSTGNDGTVLSEDGTKIWRRNGLLSLTHEFSSLLCLSPLIGTVLVKCVLPKNRGNNTYIYIKYLRGTCKGTAKEKGQTPATYTVSMFSCYMFGVSTHASIKNALLHPRYTCVVVVNTREGG